MPIYEYRCPNGHVFELFKRMDDPAPDACEVCGASPVELVLYPVAIHYKGSGFYSTDYGKGSKRKGGDAAGGTETKTETKTDSGSSSSSPSSSSGGETKKAAEA